MRRFSVRPAITIKGRTFKGLRGFAGKPVHPPLTDIPIGAYVLGAACELDVGRGAAAERIAQPDRHAQVDARQDLVILGREQQAQAGRVARGVRIARRRSSSR